MNLHYSKTKCRHWTPVRKFYYPVNLHYFKTSQEDIWSCYQCMYHRVFNYILLYHVPFFRKNILTTILVQVCSTTLRFYTSSDPQRDIWSCYRHKSHTNTLLQNLLLYDILVICCFTIPWIYTTPKPTSITPSIICGFATLWIYTTPKPQKRTEAATSVCITGNSIASYHIASLLSKTYWLPYLCKFIQLPCDFAPLQMLK